MAKCEFSETQFVIGYLRELFNEKNTFCPFFRWYMPPNRTESRMASDLIIKSLANGYTHSEFYQFKRSHLFNKKIFGNNGNQINTSINPHYGFKIYNKSTTKQFDTLKRIARKKYHKVYYCAPKFHTIKEFRINYRNNLIINRSRLIDLSQPKIQALNINVNTNHHLIFDDVNNFICSDIIEVEGLNGAEQRNLEFKINDGSNSNFKETIDLIKKEINDFDNIIGETIYDYSNVLSLRDAFTAQTGIIWLPYFNI